MTIKQNSIGLILSVAMTAGLASAVHAKMEQRPTTTPSKSACRAAAPAITTATPSRWLGTCTRGLAEGVGVLRIGSREPFQFFFGEMRGGRPVRGLIRAANGWYPAAAFDARFVAVNPRSWTPEQGHGLYVLAVRAARTTARRFATAGNRTSATYYERLAQEIADGESD